MEKIIKPIRIAIIFIFITAVMSIYVVSLYDLQINQGDDYREMSQNNINSTTTVEASRGNIYDRNGNLLVGNKVINNVTINWTVLSSSGSANRTLLNLARAAESSSVVYNDSLPISADAPFEFTEISDTQQSYLDAYKEYYSLDEDISATELMAYMRNKYNVDPTYNAVDARTIVGIRFELDMRYVKVNLAPYVFAEDVGTDFIAVIGERNFVGIEIEETSVREPYTTYAAHILGTTGKMSESEMETYVKEKGYPNDAYVGKSGVEKYFEDYLHGTNGTEITTTNSSGTVVGITTDTETEPGNHLYLSIDIDLQATAETALQTRMTEINSKRTAGQEKATEGAAVVMDVKTGQALAMASIPTYNLSTFYDDYETLAEDKSKPLLNRTTSEIYPPGSTFKMVTAMAALNEGAVTEYSTVDCTRVFNLSGTTFNCTSAHGATDLRRSLTVSCNFYYYTMADRLNYSILEQYASMFGLGESTGIELGESTGRMDGKTYRQSVYDSDPEAYAELFSDNPVNTETGEVRWYDGNTLHASIGQGESRFTPLQIASYVSTIANKGTRYSATILDRIETYDGSGIVYEAEPEVLNTIDVPDEYWTAIQEGMKGVTDTGTAKDSLLHGYSVSLASKTGTAQTTLTEDTNTSLFVCFAPYDDPEIAVAVVIENGGAGSNSIAVAYEILEEYFSSDGVVADVQGENTLLG